MSDCIPWQGDVKYPQYRIPGWWDGTNGRKGEFVNARKYIYEMRHGPIQESQRVRLRASCHDNNWNLCVNVDHLELRWNTDVEWERKMMRVSAALNA